MLHFKRVISCFFLIFLGLRPGAGRAEGGQLSPLVYQVFGGSALPFLGSDGEYHLVYEILLTNVSPKAWTLDRIEVFGEGKDPLLKLSGEALKSRVGSLSSRGGSSEIGPNQMSMAWLHLKVRSKDDLPKKIHHRISVSGNGKSLEMEGAALIVSFTLPLEIGPPLRGGDWVAADGCCDSIRHVRAVLPIDGSLYLTQRFAIDWEKLNEARQIYSGDAKNPESYFCYGQEVLAVADAEVVAAVDGLPNQVPGHLPDSIDLAQADGNHIVLQLAPGQYALYAHLKPGSVRVKAGDQVKAGQVLAQVGNTGNTSEPHLHFHMMDGPSPLMAKGLPYLIRSFDLLGRGSSTQAFDQAAATGTPLEILPVKGKGNHRGQLPLDLSLVRFGE